MIITSTIMITVGIILTYLVLTGTAMVLLDGSSNNSTSNAIRRTIGIILVGWLVTIMWLIFWVGVVIAETMAKIFDFDM